MISQKISALPYIAVTTGLGLKISKRNLKDFMTSIFQGVGVSHTLAQRVRLEWL